MLKKISLVVLTFILLGILEYYNLQTQPNYHIYMAKNYGDSRSKVEHYTKAIELIFKVKDNSEQYTIFECYYDIYKETGDLKDYIAMDEVTKAEAKNNSNDTTLLDIEKGIVKDLTEEAAERYFDMNNYQEAINKCHDYIEYKKEPNQKCLEIIADSYKELKDYDNAISYYKKVSDLDPESIAPFVHIAFIYLEKKDMRQAFKILYSLENSPHFEQGLGNNKIRVYQGLSFIYEMNNDYQKALSYLDKVNDIVRSSHMRSLLNEDYLEYNAKAIKRVKSWANKEYLN